MVAATDRRLRANRVPHDAGVPLAALHLSGWVAHSGWRPSARLSFNRAAALSLGEWEYVRLSWHRRGRCIILERAEPGDGALRLMRFWHDQRVVAVGAFLRACGLQPWAGRVAIHVLTPDVWAVGPLPREVR